MQTLQTLEELSTIAQDVVIAVGVFDGVHLGHQQVIELCHEKARAKKAAAWVMTFEPHPMQIVHPTKAPKLLTSLSAKLERLELQEIEGCMVIPFTREFSNLEPEVFLDQLVQNIPRIRGIVVGENWHFGKKARGNVTLLKTLAKRYGFDVYVAPPVVLKNKIISSSRIREALKVGDLNEARDLLGRPYAVRGLVVHGLKRGHRLGFPTANLDLRGYALPPSGIYASIVHHDNKRYAGALYLSSHPEPQHGALEVHLIDFENDLYGKTLHVEFIKKIREDNRRFDNDRELIDQIREDVTAIDATVHSFLKSGAS